MAPVNLVTGFPWTFLNMCFFVLCCIAILRQLNAQHGPTWPQLGAQNRPKNPPRWLPRVIFKGKPKTLNFDNTPMVLLVFSCPERSWEAHFRLNIGVLMQHVIQRGFETSSKPLW